MLGIRVEGMSSLAMNVTASSVVMTRAASISLIRVDWANDMLYWLEIVNNTHVVVSIVVLQHDPGSCKTFCIFYQQFVKINTVFV